jgi:hypothetical protein
MLARVDYDPFRVMPDRLPPAPRVFATAAHLKRARQRLEQGSVVDRHCLDSLVRMCRLDEPLPELQTANEHPDWGGPLMPWLESAFNNALVWRLTDDPRHRARAIDALRRSVHACTQITSWTGHENNEARAAARAYDLIVTGGLDKADNRAFRAMLRTLIKAVDHAGHRSCNNHNSMQMSARLSLAAALGDRQAIHDSFYGCQRRGRWRYGLIHLLRHDFLADGMQWEGAPAYHMLVVMMACESFTIMEHLGVDLWHRAWPSLMQDDGFDDHRGWGPKGTKPLTAAFDAMLYQVFPNGDYSLLHDSGLGNLRGAGAWSNVLGKAFEVYREPRYAWALRQINRGVVASAGGPVPAWFAEDRFVADFVRLEMRDFPVGENPLGGDRALSLTGRHEAGCSLFPTHGSALLRSDPLDERAPAAYLYWGPHWSGHRSPAALHMDIHALGWRVTAAPHLYDAGYGDPRHKTWFRSTLAHNTIAVDERSMFPYDFDGASLWECDHWRDTISDGVLESFQPGKDLKAVRASNDNVYSGMKLDRTVAVTRDGVLDVFRVTAGQPRLLDWVVHCLGLFRAFPTSETVDMGSQPGYRHLEGARMLPAQRGWATLPFTLGEAPACCSLWLDGAPDARLIVADDPAPCQRKPYGELNVPLPRTSLIVRTRAASALFVSLWSFGSDVTGGAVRGQAGTDVTVDLSIKGRSQRWRLPLRGEVSVDD